MQRKRTSATIVVGAVTVARELPSGGWSVVLDRYGHLHVDVLVRLNSFALVPSRDAPAGGHSGTPVNRAYAVGAKGLEPLTSAV